MPLDREGSVARGVHGRTPPDSLLHRGVTFYRTPNGGTDMRHSRWTTTLRMVFGTLFLILGILGLFLPILQGLLFLAVGIALLADHIPIFARIRSAVYRRFPKVEHAVTRLRASFQRGKHRA